jgi:hypothetical protein
METMARIYKKKPFFVLQHWWDTKTVLPKVYKLQSNNLRNKYKAEIHKDDGLLGIEFTLNKTISEVIRASEKLPGLRHKLCPVWQCAPWSSRCNITPWLRTSCV